MKGIILAAGIGSRLGYSNPKPLTSLSSGESILKRQINYLSESIGIDNIMICSLGSRILRADTAALVTIALIQMK